MTFEECVKSLQEGSVVNFREYTLDRHERKHLAISIEGAIIKEIFPAGKTLPRETLVTYYGEELDDIDYLQLSTSNCPRLVLSLGINQDNQLDIKIVTLNKDFFNTHLQEIEVIGGLDVGNLYENEPNYVMSQNFMATKGW